MRSNLQTFWTTIAGIHSGHSMVMTPDSASSWVVNIAIEKYLSLESDKLVGKVAKLVQEHGDLNLREVLNVNDFSAVRHPASEAVGARDPVCLWVESMLVLLDTVTVR